MTIKRMDRIRSVMFTVESVDDTVDRLRANGAELVGELPAGIIVSLAEGL